MPLLLGLIPLKRKNKKYKAPLKTVLKISDSQLYLFTMHVFILIESESHKLIKITNKKNENNIKNQKKSK